MFDVTCYLFKCHRKTAHLRYRLFGYIENKTEIQKTCHKTQLSGSKMDQFEIGDFIWTSEDHSESIHKAFHLLFKYIDCN